MVRKIFGSNMVDYVVPTAIVGLVVGMSLYTMVDQDLLKKFLIGSTKGAMDNSELVIAPKDGTTVTSSTTTTSTAMGGTLGGTPDEPVTKCSWKTCDIDFGEFMLTGIPENFDEYVEAAGTSGGTEAILALVEQMAEQLEESGDTAGAAEFKKLANLGHILADSQALAESKAKTCNDEPDPISCFRDSVHQPSEMELTPAKLSALPEFDPGQPTVELIRQSKFFEVKEQLDNDPTAAEDMKKHFPAFEMMEIYESIMADSKYSSSMKEVTKQLLLNIDDLVYTQNGLIESSLAGAPVDFPKINFVTGTDEGPRTFDITSGMSSVTNPSFSSGTNFNSSLICSTAKFSDADNECK